MSDIKVVALGVECPACLSKPGKPCTQPTSESRVNVVGPV